MRVQSRPLSRRKDDMIRVQVAGRTKAVLQEMANEQCRTLSNLCLWALVKRDRVGNLGLGNDEGTPWAARARLSLTLKTARINIRCHRQLKENVQREAKDAGHRSVRTATTCLSGLELARVKSPSS